MKLKSFFSFFLEMFGIYKFQTLEIGKTTAVYLPLLKKTIKVIISSVRKNTFTARPVKDCDKVHDELWNEYNQHDNDYLFDINTKTPIKITKKTKTKKYLKKEDVKLIKSEKPVKKETKSLIVKKKKLKLKVIKQKKQADKETQ